MNTEVIALCKRLTAMTEQVKQLDRELRRLLNISELSLEQCEEAFDLVPVCYTRFKLAERILELKGESSRTND